MYNVLLKNYILLLFKIYVYNSRKHEKSSLNNLIRNVKKIKNIEKEIAGNNEKKLYCITKVEKNVKQVKREKLVSLIYLRGGGWEIFVVKYLLFSVITYLSISFCCFFYLFFVCVCVRNFRGSHFNFILVLFN